MANVRDAPGDFGNGPANSQVELLGLRRAQEQIQQEQGPTNMRTTAMRKYAQIWCLPTAMHVSSCRFRCIPIWAPYAILWVSGGPCPLKNKLLTWENQSERWMCKINK